METSIDILSELSVGTLTKVPTKKEISDNVNAIISFVNDGELNPLDIALAMKSLDELASQVRKGLKDKTNILEEAEKYGSKTFQYKGAKIEIKEAGVSYDYSDCNDSETTELEFKIAELQDKIKDRRDFLKALKEPIVKVDEDTGEPTKIYPPKKKSSTTVAITLPKE